MAVGRNGKVWIDIGAVRLTIVVGQLLKKADEEGLDVEGQKKAVKRALKDV